MVSNVYVHQLTVSLKLSVKKKFCHVKINIFINSTSLDFYHQNEDVAGSRSAVIPVVDPEKIYHYHYHNFVLEKIFSHDNINVVN